MKVPTASEFQQAMVLLFGHMPDEALLTPTRIAKYIRCMSAAMHQSDLPQPGAENQ